MGTVDQSNIDGRLAKRITRFFRFRLSYLMFLLKSVPIGNAWISRRFTRFPAKEGY